MNGILKRANGDSNSHKSCMNYANSFCFLQKISPNSFCGQSAVIFSSSDEPGWVKKEWGFVFYKRILINFAFFKTHGGCSSVG